MSLGGGDVQVSYEVQDYMIIFNLKINKLEQEEHPHLINRSSFYYKFKESTNLVTPHSDKLALVAILTLLPLSKGTLSMDWGVSKEFSEAADKITRIQLGFLSTDASSCPRYPQGTPSLSFSGGADSTAALCVMPNLTDCVFLKRSDNPSRTLYDAHAALESCQKVSRLGYKVHVVESDFEYLRRPVGFPTDLSVGTPAILLSDTREYSSIAFGTILESAYGTSGKSFRIYEDSSHFKLWNSLFAAAGIGYSLPIAGVSEIGSTLICMRHRLGKVHQSCIRGKWGSPCLSCWKCYRKGAILDVTEGEGSPEDFGYIHKIESSREVASKILIDEPIKHEGVLTYCLERTNESHTPELDILKKLTRVGIIKTDWMGKWYSNSAKLIDSSYREEVVKNLTSIIGIMSAKDQKDLVNWRNMGSSERSRILNGLIKSMRIQ